MESNSTAFLIKIKLRHSLGRPSRSDFVQSEVEILKNKKQVITEEYDEQIEFTKETLSDMYLEQYKRILNDYPIFMAIAEDIGYDATGKETKGNELPAISEELVKFIKAIEEGNDRFFQ